VNGYVAAGYGVTLLGLAGYAAYVLQRARTLRARLGAPPRRGDGSAR
jgi:hypothetical protein